MTQSSCIPNGVCQGICVAPVRKAGELERPDMVGDQLSDVSRLATGAATKSGRFSGTSMARTLKNKFRQEIMSKDQRRGYGVAHSQAQCVFVKCIDFQCTKVRSILAAFHLEPGSCLTIA